MKPTPWRAGVLISALLVLSACVTINVYFPTVAAERAADRIIEDVWGPEVQPRGNPPEEGEPQSGLPAPGAQQPLGMRVLNVVVSPARAQADLDIETPRIRELTSRMRDRHSELRPYYESGAIGLTNDGLITVRDQSAIPLAARNAVRNLVEQDNRDRNALYREIAEANNRPEWEGDIRQTFTERWRGRAPSGWYYQDSRGNWRQK